MKSRKLMIVIGMIILIGTIHAQVHLTIEMPCCMFEPESPFFVDLKIENSATTPLSGVQVYTALTIGTGDFWFYPDWNKYPPDVSYVKLDLPGTSTITLAIMPEFNWPPGAGQFYGASFLSAALHNGDLVSNVDDCSFGWFNTSPCNCNQINFDWFHPRLDTIKVESLTFAPLCTGMMHLVFSGGSQAVVGEWYEVILADDQGYQYYYDRQYCVENPYYPTDGFITISGDIWINLPQIRDYTFTLRVGGGMGGPTLSAKGKVEFLAD